VPSTSPPRPKAPTGLPRGSRDKEAETPRPRNRDDDPSDVESCRWKFLENARKTCARGTASRELRRRLSGSFHGKPHNGEITGATPTPAAIRPSLAGSSPPRHTRPTRPTRHRPLDPRGRPTTRGATSLPSLPSSPRKFPASLVRVDDDAESGEPSRGKSWSSGECLGSSSAIIEIRACLAFATFDTHDFYLSGCPIADEGDFLRTREACKIIW
jgi:hypothetical protein